MRGAIYGLQLNKEVNYDYKTMEQCKEYEQQYPDYRQVPRRAETRRGRKGLIIVQFLLLPFFVDGQIITSIAGNGTHSNTGDGFLAINAAIDYPGGGAIDNFGNYYFITGTGGNSVRKITPSGTIITVAGKEVAGFSGDGGPATNAKLNNPQSVAVDMIGNLYISDAANNRIRKVNIATGVISTIAGIGTGGYNGDNIPATDAMIWDPYGIAVDKEDNIYIADNFNDRIRKINSSGIISTYAGTGMAGYNGDGGLADTAKLKGPEGVCVDDTGNLYIADFSNGRVRKVNLDGIIITIIGDGVFGSNGDGGLAINAQVMPQDITIDKVGNIYIDGGDYDDRVRMINAAGVISTIVGTGVEGFKGDNGQADSAELYGPSGLAIDSCGNLYIADLNNYRIRKATFNPYCWPEKENSVTTQCISIYPIPAYEAVNVKGVQGQTKYEILNINGIVEQSGTLKEGNNSIAIQSLPPGVYLLELMDEDGEKIVKKIVKD